MECFKATEVYNYLVSDLSVKQLSGKKNLWLAIIKPEKTGPMTQKFTGQHSMMCGSICNFILLVPVLTCLVQSWLLLSLTKM